MITPGRGSVTFQTPWNMSPRAIAAFDELVSAGALSVEDGVEGLWARTYRARINCLPAYRWFSRNTEKGRWSCTVPADERRERPPRDWKRLPVARPLGVEGTDAAPLPGMNPKDVAND
jgi:hypothetical protein